MSDLTQRLFPVAQEQLTSDDYYTPAWVFERMAITFDLDVCSPPRRHRLDTGKALLHAGR